MLGLQSKTLRQVSRLANKLPPSLKQQIFKQLPIAVLPGVFDAASIAVVGWMMSALLGKNLRIAMPPIPFVGTDRFDQALFLIALFIVLSWLRSLSKLLALARQERLVGELWLWLTNTIYARILSQPYEFHIGKNEKKLATHLLTNVGQVTKGVLLSLMQLQSSLFTIIFLLLGLIYVGRGYALTLFISLLVAYASFSIVLTPRLRKYASERIKLASLMKQSFFDSLNVIKEVHLSSAEPYFVREFSTTARKVKRIEALAHFMPLVPRQVIEPLGITLIFALGAMPLIFTGGKLVELKQIIPFLATLALASQRITPALQDFFAALTRLRSALPNINSVLGFLKLPPPTGMSAGHESLGISPEGICPKRSIRLTSVTYSYPGRNSPVLSDLSLTIPVGSRTAFVGATGSGKSTTAHMLLGLLSPNSGSLDLDGVPVNEDDLRAWHACCAYVPQVVSFLRGSIIENIAFAEHLETVDTTKVWEALEAAQLQDVVSSLPKGLYTPIGKDGIHLSGGQRQRLALARAFYRRAEFLVLDEATSALDNQTESDVISSIELIARRCTVLVIAHRLSTVVRCDKIYEFDSGRVIASGSYDQLKTSSPTFRRLTMLEGSSVS